VNRWIEGWNSYWFPKSSGRALSLWRIVVVAAQLFLFLPDLQINLNLLEKNTGFIAPQLLIVAISAVIPGELLFTPAGLELVYRVTIASGVAALAGLFTRASIFVFALGNWILIAHRFSYADIHHPSALFGIFLMLLVFAPCGRHFSIDALIRGRRETGVDRSDGTVDTAVWPIRLIHVLLAITYFTTGLVKIVYGGLQWMNGYTLQYIMLADGLRRDLPLGIWLSQQYTLCLLLSIYTVFFELFFFVSVIAPRTASYFLVGGIFFHIGLYVFSGHEFFQHLTLLILLLVFFESERCKLWLQKAEFVFSARRKPA
jgi:hypothetical protein